MTGKNGVAVDSWSHSSVKQSALTEFNGCEIHFTSEFEDQYPTFSFDKNHQIYTNITPY